MQQEHCPTCFRLQSRNLHSPQAMKIYHGILQNHLLGAWNCSCWPKHKSVCGSEPSWVSRRNSIRMFGSIVADSYKDGLIAKLAASVNFFSLILWNRLTAWQAASLYCSSRETVYNASSIRDKFPSVRFDGWPFRIRLSYVASELAFAHWS